MSCKEGVAILPTHRRNIKKGHLRTRDGVGERISVGVLRPAEHYNLALCEVGAVVGHDLLVAPGGDQSRRLSAYVYSCQGQQVGRFG